MFNVIDIAQAEFKLRNEQNLRAGAVEGMTVQVPNIIDRMLLAVRARLTRGAARTYRASITCPSTAAAK